MKSAILAVCVAIFCLVNSAQATLIVSLSNSTPIDQYVCGNQTVLMAKFKLMTDNDGDNLTYFSVKCTGANLINYLTLMDGSSVLGTAAANSVDVLQNTAMFTFSGLDFDTSYVSKTLSLQANLGLFGDDAYGTLITAGIYDENYLTATDIITGKQDSILLNCSLPVVSNPLIAVPEPGTLVLILVATAIGAVLYIRRKR